MGRVLSLYLPSLAIDRLQRKSKRRQRGSDAREHPPAVLLVANERGQQVVVQACRASQRCGVQVGMSLAHARALLGHEVVVQPHEPARDAAALDALARWAIRFTPVVQADAPDGLLLQIAGCEHLHGGTRQLLRHVIEQTRQLGVRGRAGVGPTVGCAWALARFGYDGQIVDALEDVPDALAPLPVRALRIEREIEASLHAVAVETVGQLMRLPRGSLAERFGQGLLLRLDQATGAAFESLEPIRPSEPVRVQRLFDGPVKQLEAILQSARELVEALCRELATREAGARQLRLDLERIDAHDLSEAVTLSRPSRDARHLWALLRPTIERIHMGHGIERVTLHASSLGRIAHQQERQETWPGEASGKQMDRCIGELVDRLAGRFGVDRVCVIQPRATYVPERAFVHQPAHQAGAPPPEPGPVIDADRPTLLHRRPEPVQVMLLAPDGPVLAMRRGRERVRIITTLGPERITPRWWLSGDANRTSAPRDYFKLQDEHGQWWWLYRQADTARWFVHGRWC